MNDWKIRRRRKQREDLERKVEESRKLRQKPLLEADIGHPDHDTHEDYILKSNNDVYPSSSSAATSASTRQQKKTSMKSATSQDAIMTKPID